MGLAKEERNGVRSLRPYCLLPTDYSPMHPLQQRLSHFRRRVRRWLAIDAASRLMVVALGALLVLGGADYLIRFDDPGLRLINSFLAAGLIAWAGYRYLWRGLSVRLGDLRLARAVQRQIPELGDRLATAIEFLQQPADDPTAGSPALRRAVVEAATVQTADLDFSTVLDPRPARRAAWLATGVTLLAALLLVVDPLACQIAVARLARPLGRIAWPQRHHLDLRRPVVQVARGQAFEVEAIDAEGVPLPADLRVHYRMERPDGTQGVETEPLQRQGRAMLARRENVTRPFAYRLEGGDDHTQPWIDVTVVEPPAVQTLIVRLTPPAYTGWLAYESTKQIRVLAGTRAEFRVQATKPLAAAALVLDGRTIPAQLTAADQFRVPGDADAPLVLRRSGSYGLSLTDREGISEGDGERFEIRVVPDGPPSAAIEQPSADLYVTPQALVPMRVTAKDDLAVAAIDLVFQLSESDAENASPAAVYRGPARAPAQPAFSPASTLPPVDYRWDLAPLRLAPKAILTYHVEARDYAGAVGHSSTRRLAVVTAEELLQRLAERQTLLAAELGRVAAIERESRSQVGGSEARLAETGRLEQLDVDHLQAAAMAQRQAAQVLTSRTDGIAMLVLAILADVENNRLNAPGVKRRMQALLAEIERLEREHLPVIDQELTAAIKAAQIRLGQAGASPPVGAGLKTALARSAEHQTQVLLALEQMLGALAQWQSYRRFQRDLTDLLREQEELNRVTAELSPQTIGRELSDLLPAHQAELKRQAGRQLDLSLRFDQLLAEMYRAAATLASQDAQAAGSLSNATDEAARLAIGARMRSVRAALDGNQMGQAASGQKQIAADLHRVLDTLSATRQPPSAEADVEKLAAAVRRLATRQTAILKETRAAAPTVERLATQQHALAGEARQWVPQLGPDSAFALAMDQAAGHMRQAAELLDDRQTAESTQQAQQAALRRLAMILEALAPEQASGRAEQGGSQGSPSRRPGPPLSVTQLKLLRLMQQDVLARTEQLERSGANVAAQRYAELSAEQRRLAEMLLRLLRTEK